MGPSLTSSAVPHTGDQTIIQGASSSALTLASDGVVGLGGYPTSAPGFLSITQPSITAALSLQQAAHALSTFSNGTLSSIGAPSVPPLPVRGAAVGASLPPVLGYLVQKIADGEYINFTLLRPINLWKLPASELAQAQLTRLLRSELSPVRSFEDWAEAWALYAGVVHTRNPGSLGDLISYFLLLSSAAREMGGNGWQQYDAAFRKRAADDKTMKWGEALPTLWVTSVLGSSRTSQSSQPRQVCFNWNNSECSFPNCHYYHICSQCLGSHKVKNCNVPVAAGSQPFTQDQEVTQKPSRK